VTKIKELPKEERPVERLLENGVNSLSNEELLAILLKSGTKNCSSKQLAENLIKKAGGIQGLKNLPLSKLLEEKGMGTVKAATILSCMTLCKRIEKKEHACRKKITSSQDVVDYFMHELQDAEQEHFYCVYLDSAKHVLEHKLLFLGTLNYSLVHPREVFKEAFLTGAVSLIFIHNHPTGEVLPSKNDIELTKQLEEIGQIHGIKVEDHIIIGREKYYSFFEDCEMAL
jgi:DNA repair protein RadC